MKFTSKIALLFLVSPLIFTSCKKSDKQNDNTAKDNKAMVNYLAKSDNFALEMDNAADQAYAEKTGNNTAQKPLGVGILGPCATLTLTQDNGLFVLTIDYGSEGCVCDDGKTRKGKIIATSTDFTALNVTRTITTDSFYVNDYHVDGTITRDITKDFDAHTRQANITENIIITSPDGQYSFTRNATLTRILNWYQGGNTLDNTYTTWGTVNITRPNGNQISRIVSADNPLLYKNECTQTVSGVATITLPNHTFTVDFGDGVCDGVATVTNELGESWTVNL